MNRSGKSILKWLAATSQNDSPTTRSLSAGMQIWLDECSSIQNGPPSELRPMSTIPTLPELAAAQLTTKTFLSDSEWRRPDLATSGNGGISASWERAIQREEERLPFIIEALNYSAGLSMTKPYFLKLLESLASSSSASSSCAVPVTRLLSEATPMKNSTPNSLKSTVSNASQERLTRDEMFIEMAHTAAKRGTCNRLKVGAVIALDSRPISMGYNGTPPGAAHCGPECTANNPCTKTLHAEANAIRWATRGSPDGYGVGTEDQVPGGCTIYVTDSPCIVCASLIHQAGISRVVYDRAYRIRDGIEYLENQGIEVVQCHVKPVIDAN